MERVTYQVADPRGHGQVHLFVALSAVGGRDRPSMGAEFKVSKITPEVEITKHGLVWWHVILLAEVSFSSPLSSSTGGDWNRQSLGYPRASRGSVMVMVRHDDGNLNHPKVCGASVEAWLWREKKKNQVRLECSLGLMWLPLLLDDALQLKEGEGGWW